MTECLCIPQVQDDLQCSCGDEECLFGDVCSILSNNSSVCTAENLDLPPLVCPDKGPGEPCESADECESNFCADATDQLRPCTGSPGCLCLPKKDERVKKFSFEQCVSNTECAGLRVCADFDPAKLCALTDLEPDQNCVCVPIIPNQQFCSCISDNCVEGDICVGNSQLSAGKPQQGSCTSSKHSGLSRLDCTPRLPLALSELPSPQPSSQPETVDSTLQPTTPPSPSPSATLQVCIDATALTHLQPHQLLYKLHPHATVLCDQFGSCATPGHIVRYKRSTMMMKTSCRIKGCTQHTVRVNSPRYARGIRVESKTSGLQFTAFAARHETRAEESIMALAVRLGL